jgi:hypothetical protein
MNHTYTAESGLYLELYQRRERLRKEYNIFCEILKNHYGDNVEITPLSFHSLFSTFHSYKKYKFTNGLFKNELISVGYHFNFSILYPRITIKNAVGQEHLIKDLIFSVYVDKVNSFLGTRLTLSEEEYHSDYFHSHLTTSWNELGEFNYFCLGTYTFLAALAKISILDYPNKEILPFCFDDYVKWESLEGTPYISIKDVGLRSPYFKENQFKFNKVEFSFDQRTNIKIGKDFKIKNRREISEELAQYENVPRVLDINGQLFTENKNDKPFTPTNFQFNGQNIQTKIEKQENQENNVKYYTEPNYLEEYCRFWEEQIYQNTVADNYAKRQNNFNYFSENNTSDSVSM